MILVVSQNEYFDGFKQAQRRDDDISIVNAGMRVAFKEGSNEIEDVSLAFGGMAPITVLAKKTMAGLVGKYVDVVCVSGKTNWLYSRNWDDSLVPAACRLLQQELLLAPGTPGGMEAFRNTLTTSFFFKFFLRVTQKLGDRKASFEYSEDRNSYVVSDC